MAIEALMRGPEQQHTYDVQGMSDLTCVLTEQCFLDNNALHTRSLQTAQSQSVVTDARTCCNVGSFHTHRASLNDYRLICVWQIRRRGHDLLRKVIAGHASLLHGALCSWHGELMPGRVASTVSSHVKRGS